MTVGTVQDKRLEELEQKIRDIRNDLSSRSEKLRRAGQRFSADLFSDYFERLSATMDEYPELTPREVINFEHCNCQEPVVLPEGRFPPIAFDHCRLLGGLRARGTVFTGQLRLTNVPNNSSVNFDFERTRFCNGLHVEGCGAHLRFFSTCFTGEQELKIQNSSKVCFEDCTIAASLRLEDIHESIKLHGRNVERSFSVSSPSARRLGVEVLNTEFESLVTFSGEFGQVRFEDVTFRQVTNFSKCHFLRTLVFEESIIHEKIYLNSTNHDSPFRFIQNKFYRPPVIYDSKRIHPESTFYLNEFIGREEEEDARAYHRLAEIAKKIRSPLDEAEFFVLEQRTLANVERARKKILNPFLSSWYDRLSEYGQSAFRPIQAFLVLSAFSWLIYCSPETWQNLDCNYPENGHIVSHEQTVSSRMYVRANRLRCANADYPNAENDNFEARALVAAHFVLQNIFNPFSYYSHKAALIPRTIILIMIAALQSVLTYVLVALAVLAVRRRFKKGSSGDMDERETP